MWNPFKRSLHETSQRVPETIGHIARDEWRLPAFRVANQLGALMIGDGREVSNFEVREVFNDADSIISGGMSYEEAREIGYVAMIAALPKD